MIAENMKTMTNPSTGNQFYVIATTENLQAGIRFWAGSSYGNKHNTELGFRFRIVSREGDGVVIPMDFHAYVSELFPEAKWNGSSGSHVSVAGGAKINVPIWQYDNLLEAIDKADMGGAMFDLLMEQFRLFLFNISREQFAELFKEEVAKIAKPFLPADNGKTAVVLQFGSVTKKFEDGKVVSDAPVAESVLLTHEPINTGNDSIVVPKTGGTVSGDDAGEPADVTADAPKVKHFTGKGELYQVNTETGEQTHMGTVTGLSITTSTNDAPDSEQSL